MSKSVQIAGSFIAAAVLGGVAMPTWAVDGVILIDQNKALAGNVTPGDVPGFPVTISLPGSYRLSSNLTVPDASTTAIVITTPGVTLDLNGFSIIGPMVCTGFPVTSCIPSAAPFSGGAVGVDASGGFSTTVLNGTISGFRDTGVALQGSSTAQRLQVFSCGHGITSNGEGLIVDNHAHNNGGDGIVLAGVDLARGNLVRGNAGAGIESFFHGSTVSGGNAIINNTISANGVGLILYVGDGYGGNVLFQNGISQPRGNAVQIAPNVCGAALCP